MRDAPTRRPVVDFRLCVNPCLVSTKDNVDERRGRFRSGSDEATKRNESTRGNRLNAESFENFAIASRRIAPVSACEGRSLLGVAACEGRVLLVALFVILFSEEESAL